MGAQNLAQPLIDSYRVLRGLIDHFDPAARVLGRTGLHNQISGLHDGFERVTEIVREYAKFLRYLRRNFIGIVSNGCGLWVVAQFENCRPSAAKALFKYRSYRSGEPLRHPKSSATALPPRRTQSSLRDLILSGAS